MSEPYYVKRRRFLQWGLAGCASLAALRVRADEPSPSASVAERWLEMYNGHTGETLALPYRDGSGLRSDALDRFSWLLRDFRAQQQHPIDPALYDILADLAAAAGAEPRFEIISGYRSPQTNEMLAEAGHGVALHSMHLQGRAIDLRLRGVGCDRVRDLALSLQRGGVGYYRSSDFVHVDTGRIRTWNG